jgi:hypothetical protein
MGASKFGSVARTFALNAADASRPCPSNAGEDIGPGLLRRIERDLAPCLGKGWLK